MIRRSRRGAVVWAGVVLVAVALGGCSADEDAPLPSASSPSPVVSTASPTPSLTPVVVPTLPAAAQQETTTGAEAFFRHWFALHDASFDLLDPSLVLAVSDSECIFCNSTADAVRDAVPAGERFRGGEIEVISALAAPTADFATGTIVTAFISQAAGETIDRTGAAVDSYPTSDRIRVDAAVRWQSGAWIMLDINVIEEGES